MMPQTPAEPDAQLPIVVPPQAAGRDTAWRDVPTQWHTDQLDRIARATGGTAHDQNVMGVHSSLGDAPPPYGLDPAGLNHNANANIAPQQDLVWQAPQVPELYTPQTAPQPRQIARPVAQQQAPVQVYQQRPAPQAPLLRQQGLVGPRPGPPLVNGRPPAYHSQDSDVFQDRVVVTQYDPHTGRPATTTTTTRTWMRRITVPLQPPPQRVYQRAPPQAVLQGGRYLAGAAAPFLPPPYAPHVPAYPPGGHMHPTKQLVPVGVNGQRGMLEGTAPYPLATQAAAPNNPGLGNGASPGGMMDWPRGPDAAETSAAGAIRQGKENNRFNPMKRPEGRFKKEDRTDGFM